MLPWLGDAWVIPNDDVITLEPIVENQQEIIFLPAVEVNSDEGA